MSPPLRFTTDVVAPDQRLNVFRAGAVDYQVDALGDPLDFTVHWDLAVLNDVNLVETCVTPVRYRRTAEMIARDGKDRISVLYLLDGGAEGVIDDEPVVVAPGDAMVFDLLRTIDVRSPAQTRYRILTVPRHLIEEVLPHAHLDGRIAASDRLRLVFDQVALLLRHAGALPPAAAAFQMRALRNLLCAALLPAYRPLHLHDPAAPLLQRITEAIDRAIADEHGVAGLARALGVEPAAVAAAVDRFGGLATMIDRRRLLHAFRRLSDPGDQSQISAIALESGFADRATFTRLFRAVFRCAPRDVRTHRHGQLPLWAGAYHVAESYGSLLV